jgi:hypothetical protein
MICIPSAVHNSEARKGVDRKGAATARKGADRKAAARKAKAIPYLEELKFTISDYRLTNTYRKRQLPTQVLTTSPNLSLKSMKALTTPI